MGYSAEPDRDCHEHSRPRDRPQPTAGRIHFPLHILFPFCVHLVVLVRSFVAGTEPKGKRISRAVGKHTQNKCQ